jgi:hypothetical protein
VAVWPYADSVNGGNWTTLVLAGATVIMAGATVWLGRWARNEAIATVRLGDESKRDRELAAQPHLSALWPTRRPFTLTESDAVFLTNAGAGPALGARYIGRREDGFGLVSAALDVAANEHVEVHPTNSVRPKVAERMVSWTARQGGDGQVAGVIVCTDVLGARHRFLLRGDAFGLPVVIRGERWASEEPTPPWAEDDPAVWPLD